MHIVMLSDMETQGGAAIAASRLATSLCEMGHSVIRLVNNTAEHSHNWDTVRLRPSGRSPLVYRIANRLLPYRTQVWWDQQTSYQRLMDTLDQRLLALRPDIINVHNLHGASDIGWSPELLGVCLHRAPTVWTLHDMWSFTGRCAYSYDCRKFLDGCDAACPTATEYPSLEPGRIAAAWEARRRLFEMHPQLVAVTPSRWLAREAQKGLWAGHRVELIPYGVPVDVYRPLDRQIARAALGIETTNPVLLVVAQDLSERRKGGTLLREALGFVSKRPITVLSLGSRSFNIEAPGIDFQPLGYVDHERTRVLAYCAADVLVHPAPVDNLPNVVMEAISCGTPVAAFATGGIPDMVRPGTTGWLADEISPQALAKVIDTAIGELDARDWRASCRALAETEYRLEHQARSYVKLFSSIARERPAAWGKEVSPSWLF